MVQRLIKIFHREWSGLHEAAYLLGVFALFSQILALVRDRLLASSFGAGTSLDVYYAAFRIPDFIYFSVASLVSVSVLIPFFIKKIEENKEHSQEEAYRFINNIFSVFFVAIVLVSLLVFFLMPLLSDLLVPGFDIEAKNSLVLLSRILLLSPILLGLSNLLGSITQSYKQFLVYALSPVFYNVGIIVGIVFLYPVFGLAGLAWGVALGALMHLSIQVPAVIKRGFILKFSFNFNFQSIKEVVFLSLPRTIALSINQLSFIFLVGLASLMGEGSISIFNFSFNLQSVPLSIIGVSYSVAAFPTLARLFSNGEKMQFAKNVAIAAKHIIFWSLPILVLFIILRAQIVRTILGVGKFDWSDTRLTAAALALFAVSVVAQSLILLFVRGYYAAGNTRTPLLINIFSTGVIIGSAFGLIQVFKNSDFFKYFVENLLRVEDLSGTSILMLPLAFSIGSIVNALLLWVLLKKILGTFLCLSSILFFIALRALS